MNFKKSWLAMGAALLAFALPASAELPFDDAGETCQLTMDWSIPQYIITCQEEKLSSVPGPDEDIEGDGGSGSGSGEYSGGGPGGSSGSGSSGGSGSNSGGYSYGSGSGSGGYYGGYASSSYGGSSGMVTAPFPSTNSAAGVNAAPGGLFDASKCDQTLNDKLYTHRTSRAWGYWEDRSTFANSPNPDTNKPVEGPYLRNVRMSTGGGRNTQDYWKWQEFKPYVNVVAVVTYCRTGRFGGAVAVIGQPTAMFTATYPWFQRAPFIPTTVNPIADDANPLNAPSYDVTFAAHFEKCPNASTGGSGGVSVGTTFGISGGAFNGNVCVDGLDVNVAVHVPVTGAPTETATPS